MKTAPLVSAFNENPCGRAICPTLPDLEKYAKGRFAELDEPVFNFIEDCLFELKCPVCLAIVEEVARQSEDLQA